MQLQKGNVSFGILRVSIITAGSVTEHLFRGIWGALFGINLASQPGTANL